MYLSELVGGLRRRWWVVLAGLLATAALTYAAFDSVPPEQEARAALIILPPPAVAAEAGNPYLALGGLEPAADMVAATMNSGPIHESLAPAAGSAKLEVARDKSSSGPMISVQVTDTDPAKTLSVLNSAIDAMPQVLAELQQRVEVKDSNLLTVVEVARDTQAKTSTERQLRATLVAGVGGLAVTLFATNMLDGLLLRRSQKRRGSNPTGAVSAGTQQDDVRAQPDPDRAPESEGSEVNAQLTKLDGSSKQGTSSTDAGPAPNSVRSDT